MGVSWIGVIFVLILALVFGQAVPQRVRDKWFPMVFAFVLWSDATGRLFFASGISYYASFFVTFIGYAFLLSDLRILELRRNNVWLAFAVFFGWFMLAAAFGEQTLVGEKFACIQLRTVLCGFAVAAWALRVPGNMERLIRWATFSAALSALQFAKYGSWSAAQLADEGGRLVIDAETTGISTNVNRIALIATAIIGFPVAYLLHRWNWKKEKVVKGIAAAALLVISLVIIKTGSRNGGLALLAVVGYFLFGRTNIKNYQKVLILVAASVAMFVAIQKFIGNTEMRTFQLVTQVESDRGIYGTGRLEFYKSVYDSMTPVQKLIGAGVPAEFLVEAGGWHIANRHSMYMQIFNQSGYVGIILLFVFSIRIYLVSRNGGSIAAMGVFFFGIWLLTGVGEASNMIAGIGNYGLGIGIALCGGARFYNRQVLQWQWWGANRT